MLAGPVALQSALREKGEIPMKNRTEERTNEELRAVQSLKKEIIYMLEKLDERKLQRVLWYIRRIW